MKKSIKRTVILSVVLTIMLMCSSISAFAMSEGIFHPVIVSEEGLLHSATGHAVKLEASTKKDNKVIISYPELKKVLEFLNETSEITRYRAKEIDNIIVIEELEPSTDIQVTSYAIRVMHQDEDIEIIPAKDLAAAREYVKANKNADILVARTYSYESVREIKIDSEEINLGFVLLRLGYSIKYESNLG